MILRLRFYLISCLNPYHGFQGRARYEEPAVPTEFLIGSIRRLERLILKQVSNEASRRADITFSNALFAIFRIHVIRRYFLVVSKPIAYKQFLCFAILAARHAHLT